MSASMVNSIAELEPQTKAKIRSTQILTSLPHLISELVQNSLDAGASHIEVGIDPVEWECWVRDDGQGISAEGMGMLGKGHEQGRYITSKKYNASTAESITFGFRGEALASAMELSCLEISSRTVRSRESWSVIIKGGEQLYLGPSIRWRRERSGSTVVARDVFYNVPVRRRSHPNSTRTLDMAKKELETLALVFPHVSFSLEHTDAGQKNRILTISRTTSSLAAFRALYGKTLVGRVEELNLCSEDLKLEGFISLDGSHSRGFANFYVNKHPMAFGDIQRAIEQCFATSAFDRTALSQQDWAHRTSRSPKKSERKPVYVLNLTISPTQVDNFVEPAKSMVRFQDMRQVLAFVLEVVNRFLNRNGIAPTQTQGVQASLGLSRKRPRNQSATERVHPSSRDKLVELPSCPSRDSSGYEELPTLPDGSGYFEWTDPSSGEAFLVDSATGNSFRNSQLLDQSTIASTENFSSREIQTSYVDRHWLKKDISVSAFHAEGTSKPPEWLVRAMQRNSTFGPTEQHVFSTRLVESGTRGQGSHTHTRANIKNAHSSNFFQSSKPTSNTFSANDLRNAQVVAQVDTKFIACLIQPLSCRPERILALVDQHAADERVRVERYLEKLCLGFLRGDKDQVQNNGSKQVLLTRMELEIVARPSVLDSFARWGLCIEVNVPTSQRGIATEEPEFVQVDVTAVPDVVASKLTTDRELSEFVKRMVTAAEKEEFACWPVPSIIQEGNTWVKALRYCPAPLVELVNSKACRGAIMFNDPLDQFQCERLMQQLSQTVFPFQCAHGRPSIAPLTKVSGPRGKPSVVDWRAFDERDE